MDNLSPELIEEFLIYYQSSLDTLPDPFVLSDYWRSLSFRFPLLSSIAKRVIWMPVTSVDVERSFSQYKHLLSDQREGLAKDNTRHLLMLYYNGDIQGRFN